MAELIPTAVPFRLRARRCGDGSWSFTHSGWQHAYLPLLVAGLLAGLAGSLIALGPSAPGPWMAAFVLTAAGVAALGCVACLAWACRGLRRGVRLRVDPVRGEVVLSRAGALGGARDVVREPLDSVRIVLHGLRIGGRNRVPDPLGLMNRFVGHAAVVRAGAIEFFIAAERKQSAVEAYLRGLPAPLDMAPIEVGGMLAGFGEVAVF